MRRRTALRLAGLALAVAAGLAGLQALARSRSVQLFGRVPARHTRADLPLLLIVSFGGSLRPPWNHE